MTLKEMKELDPEAYKIRQMDYRLKALCRQLLEECPHDYDRMRKTMALIERQIQRIEAQEYILIDNAMAEAEVWLEDSEEGLDWWLDWCAKGKHLGVKEEVSS